MALRARVGIILLDEFYLNKKWTAWELREMMKLLTSGEVRLLPVLYSMTFEQLGKQMKELSEADSSTVRGASKSDAAILEELERITMIHSNTADVVSGLHFRATPCPSLDQRTRFGCHAISGAWQRAATRAS